MMKLRSLEGAASIAMRVDMNHANRPIFTQRFENRVGNRMVTTHRKRDHVGRTNLLEECLDVGMTFLETEATLHRYVANVRCVHMQQWSDAQRVLIGANPRYCPHGAWAEPRPGAIADPVLHRHT